jgi:hypothetical protein
LTFAGSFPLRRRRARGDHPSARFPGKVMDQPSVARFRRRIDEMLGKGCIGPSFVEF